MFFQNRQRLVQRVTLGDATEVEARPRLGEFGGAIFRIEF